MSWADIILPFQFGFMQNAFLIGIMVAVPTALLSCFLVMKGWALMGDAVSHAILPGIVLAYIFGFPLLIGAFLAGMLCALMTGFLTTNSRVKQDTVMGVVFSGMFGVGIVLYVSIKTDLHLDHILFGHLLGVNGNDLFLTAAIAVPVSLILMLKWKDLMLHSFDAMQAKASGLSVGILHYGLLTMISLGVVATLAATGLILAIGLLIAPGAIAFLLTRRFAYMLWLAVGISVSAMIMGIYLSFFINSAPAPTVILILTFWFMMAFIYRMARIKMLTTRMES
ncbi:metal ABC transporter permease [Alphaproteobacteria bacterium]|jgi:manganese/iron transport system permease protein|nr:metal ABC transporter permease [Alphaproteobacteria bacterium]MDC1116150.1 metal ABC transporter permease [Alphaproteobacteria bacterium]